MRQKKKNENDGKKEEKEKAQKVIKNIEKKEIEESDYFSESFKSLPKDSIDSTIIKLKNNLSSDKPNEIFSTKNDRKVKKEESESESIIGVGKYKLKECLICIKHFCQNEKLGMLSCEHCFHINCIISWFDSSKNSCPICKKNQFKI